MDANILGIYGVSKLILFFIHIHKILIYLYGNKLHELDFDNQTFRLITRIPPYMHKMDSTPKTTESMNFGNNDKSRLGDDKDYRRDQLIRTIEHAVEHMSLAELEALSYDMFTKGYISDI